MKASRGFSLAELLIATAVMVVVMGGSFALVQPAFRAMNTEPDAADGEQRLRTAVATVQRDLTASGAGVHAGSAHGELSQYIAPVLPYRWGSVPTYRADTISVLSVPFAGAHAAIARARIDTGTDSTLELRPDTGARVFQPGTIAVLIDPSSRAWDVGSVLEVAPDELRVQRSGVAFAFDAGSVIVAELAIDTYYLKVDAAAGTSQLMHFDGRLTDSPVVDNVTGLRFRYWGDPSPDTAELAEAELIDGPWIPDPASPLRFDADLLRLRRITVDIGVRMAAPWLRSPMRVREITFAVSPPNLNLGR